MPYSYLKKLLIQLVIVISLLLFSRNVVFAQGTFECVAQTTSCATINIACDTNATPNFADGSACGSYTVGSCPTGQHPCKLTSVSCPDNSRFCDGGRLKICNNGTLQQTVDCTITGGTCADTPTPPHCQSSTGGGGGGGSTGSLVNLDELIRNGVGGKVPQLTTLGAILSRLLPYLYAIAGFALLLFLIGGGFGYLTSSGDPKKMEAAKNTITMAIIGFVIIFVAYWLTQLVQYIFKLQTPGGGGIF